MPMRAIVLLSAVTWCAMCLGFAARSVAEVVGDCEAPGTAITTPGSKCGGAGTWCPTINGTEYSVGCNAPPPPGFACAGVSGTLALWINKQAKMGTCQAISTTEACRKCQNNGADSNMVCATGQAYQLSANSSCEPAGARPECQYQHGSPGCIISTIEKAYPQ